MRKTTNALARGANFGNTLNLVIETLYGGMGFNRVTAFLRDGDAFKGRVGFGAAMPEVLPNLFFPETYVTDVFHLSLANNADVFIEGVAGPKSAASIPAWLTDRFVIWRLDKRHSGASRAGRDAADALAQG